ncbi:MAG TPA: hypothetical protein VFB72_14070 [Verrucomicrobiae bacterium]|nr:hypothetical protein [Verrucomicrobiae bacterium]
MRAKSLGGVFIFLLVTAIGPCLFAQQDATNSPAAGTKEEQIAAAKQEMSNAVSRVCEIVNRPVKAYVRQGDISVSKYSPGWFHPGATKPDFNTVDVRKTQEFPYADKRFVTSDLNPGIVFVGQDLEFNSMLKYFYTNRTLPKRKLTEDEMLEINKLYRTIGKCEGDIARLNAPPETAATAQADATNAETGEVVIPGQSFETIRSIPRRTRAIYACIAIGLLLLMVIILRVLRAKRG